MINHQPPESPHTYLTNVLITMCEGCERVPVPVHLVSFGESRGLYVCADCLAEEGIHVEESEPAVLFDGCLQEVA